MDIIRHYEQVSPTNPLLTHSKNILFIIRQLIKAEEALADQHFGTPEVRPKEQWCTHCVNVAYIQGFHLNIVSEALLRKTSEVWYLGLDGTLRCGTLGNNIVLAKLVNNFNLSFLEYKTDSSYFDTPNMIKKIPVGIMVLPVINDGITTGIPRVFRPSQDAHPARVDTEDLWLLRAGHLGSEALCAMTYRARGIRLEGTPRLMCEFCVQLYAKQVISKREP